MIKGSHITNYDTPLTEDQEAQYQEYKKSLGKFGDDSIYDLRGFWLEHGHEPHEKGAHFVDKYKKPNHPSFSDESQYHMSDDGQGGINMGGSWVQKNGEYTGFIPPASTLKDPEKMSRLQRHMYEDQDGLAIITKPIGAKEAMLSKLPK
jgi:hypothetical protein